MDKEYITIGEIVNTQGTRGYVRVYPLTDFPDRFKKMRQVLVLLNGGHRQFNIEDAYKHKKFIVIKFKEILDMTAAEELKGGLLQIEPGDLVPLPAGSYYIFQVIGLDVYDPAGQYIGRVKDVLQTGANDVYVVDTGAEKKELLVPGIKQVVKEIDIDASRMIVDLPEWY